MSNLSNDTIFFSSIQTFLIAAAVVLENSKISWLCRMYYKKVNKNFLLQLMYIVCVCQMCILYKKLWYVKFNIKYIHLLLFSKSPLTEINWLQNLKKKQIHKVSYILANMVVKINNFKNVALKSFWETGKQKEVFDPKQRLWGSRTGSLDWNSLNLLPKKGVIRYKSH